MNAPAPAGATFVSVRDAEVAYPFGGALVRVLAGVTLQISGGERIALLGRSGSGKTTLLHVIGGLVELTAGHVQWHGRPLVSLDTAARGALRSRGIGYVFQGANLLPHFNAFENVSFAAHLADNGEMDRRRVAPADALALVGLADKLDHLPEELSGGEAQRVAIARALAQGPELLLCDEPTGHLDSDTGERVLDLVDALQAELGFALVVATHDGSVAGRLPRQIELEDGLVVRDEHA